VVSYTKHIFGVIVSIITQICALCFYINGFARKTGSDVTRKEAFTKAKATIVNMKLFRNISIILAISLIFSVLACSCGEQSEVEIPDGYKIASADSADYYFFVPETWTVDINSAATSAYVSSTDAAAVSVMTWSSTNSDATLEDWWNSFTADFEKVYDDFSVESEENTLVNGKTAYSVVFTGKIGEDVHKFRQVSTINGSIIYVLTYTNNDVNFDEHTEDFQGIIDNFLFK